MSGVAPAPSRMEGRKKQSTRQLGGRGEDAEVGVAAQNPKLPHVPPLGVASQQANTNDQAKPVIGWGIFEKNVILLPARGVGPPCLQGTKGTGCGADRHRHLMRTKP
jgi:hypothetical protein